MKDFSELESFVLEKIAEVRIPSVSVAVVEKGRISFARGFGLRDIASGLPATPRTLYGVGSVTKSFTALAVMQLAEEGKLSPDDPVRRYVQTPAFGRKVTIHHLLTHSSGMPGLAYAEAFIRGALGMDDSWLPLSTHEDVISFMKDAGSWVVSRPGKRFFYLNEGWVLLGHIVSKVSKTSYVDYIKNHILKPLKMTRSFFSKREVEKDADRATPYLIDRERKQISSIFPYGVTADGGLISNVTDLANYLRFYLQRGRFDGRTLVSQKLLERMVQPHITFPYEFAVKGSWLPKEFKSSFRYGYGYGWSITPDFLGNTLIGHGGDIGTFNAYIGYIPERGVGVAVLANPSPYLLSNIGRFALALAIGADPETIPLVKAETLLKGLQGRYQTYKGTMTMQVKRKGDLLVGEMHDKYTDETIPLLPERVEDDYATFYTLANGVKVPVEFSVNKGKIEMIYERYKLERTGSAESH